MSDKKDEHDTTEDQTEERTEKKRGLLDAIMPDLLKKAIAQGVEVISEEKIRETLVAELFRKAVSKGGAVADSTDGLRRMISDLPLPKEVVERLTHRIDDYKADILGLVTDEVRNFLDRIDLSYELQKLLTSLSFEISTEIRFIPNDKSVKPDIKARARVKRSRKSKDEAAESDEPTEDSSDA